MDKPTAFKHFINKAVVKKIASSLSKIDSAFNSIQFLKLTKDLDSRELKARVLLVTEHLHLHLKHPYPKSLEILMKAMEDGDLKGFELWPFSEFISQYGLDHFDLSMKGMYQLTQRFTSEFAVRPFILKNHSKVLKYFRKWATDKNVHVRRWVSEGSRPILPWGLNIPLFIMDPTHTLVLLDKLKLDDELYVRKSVANHLNDISKNHPQVVIDVIRMWEKDSSNEKDENKINWIKRHALRTLIKKGHPGALKLMGVSDRVKVDVLNFKIDKKKYLIGDTLTLSLAVSSKSKVKEKLIIDYAIDFVKSNGKMGKKVFKLKTLELLPLEEKLLKKNHCLKLITTMKFYSGTHHLTIQINGRIMGELSFYLGV